MFSFLALLPDVFSAPPAILAPRLAAPPGRGVYDF